MSRECRENVVCRPSSATLDILATFSRRTTNQSTVKMIYRENVACRHTTFSRRSLDARQSCDAQYDISSQYRAIVACRP
ncbi:hypothetical protein DPMN_097996, partial [Dreissena polymorpha]